MMKHMWVITVACLLGLSVVLLSISQDVGDDGAIVAEEMIIDEALEGDFLEMEDMPLEEVPDEELDLVDEEELPEDLPIEEPEVPVETVEDILTDELGDVPAPVADADEPAVEEIVEPPVEMADEEEAVAPRESVDGLIEEALAPPDDMEEPLAPAVVEQPDEIEEPVEDTPVADPDELPAEDSVEALAVEALGPEEAEFEDIEELPEEDLEPADLPEEDQDLDAELLPLDEEEDLAFDELPLDDEPALGEEEGLPFEELADEPVEEDVLFPVEEVPVEEPPEVVEAPRAVEPVPEPIPEPEPEPLPEPPAVVTVAPVEPVEVDEPKEKELPREIRIIIAEEQLRRKAMEHHGKELLDTAEEELADGNYLDAVRLFQESRKLLKRPGLQLERERIREGMGNAYYGQAQVYRRRQELEESLKMAETAMDFRHRRAEGLAEEIRREIAEGPEVVEVAPRARWEEPDVIDADKQVRRLLREGKQHYALKEFEKAQKKFEAILAVDPFSSEAIRLRHKTALRRYDSASAENESTRLDMMADVRESWNPRDYAAIKRQVTKEGTGVVQTEGEKETRRIRVLKKMGGIQIPNIEFRQANIFNVVDELQALSVDFDPTEDAADKGVNIILNLQAGREGEEADPGYGAPVDPFAEAGAGDQVPPITFSARYISLLDTLKIVCDLAGLKYRVEGRVVMVVPLNAAEGEIIVRMFPVLPSVEEKIPTLEADFGGGGGGFGGGGFEELERRGPVSEGQDWQKFFEEMGVEWPDGSSIKYVRTIGRIVVANTEENLSVFEDVLSLLNVVPNQIEIEARFVEINQEDAASIGLEWYLRDDWEILQAPVSPGTPLSATPRISALRDRTTSSGSGGGFTKGNRFMTELGSTDRIDDGVLTIAGILTNPGLSMVLHSLQQKGFADLLSAPKVTTQAGSSALIKVVTEYIYPTDFAVTPVTGTDAAGNSVVVGGVVEPSGFEMREVGVILEVSPDVSQENQMITLNMTPRVVSEPTWFNYGSQYTAPDGSIQQLNMQQPFFHTRSVETSISIYNGATVVMGGMITEKREDVDDKIPLVGDIPVLGRLFRSKYDQSAKRNLLIFVTARLVDPAGQPIQEMEDLADRYAEGRTDTDSAE